MAIARTRIEPVSFRNYDPASLRRSPRARRRGLPGRAVIGGAVLLGAVAQHVILSAPLEPQPQQLNAPLAAITPHREAPPVLGGKHSVAPWPAQVAAFKQVMRPGTASARPGVARFASPSTPATAQSPLLPPVGPVGDTAREAMAANPEGAIMHEPSVSVAAIRTALQAAGSPALGPAYADRKDAAEYIWDEGRVLGVDPAVLMAFFHHESGYGTAGMARATMSVGNIRPLPGQPQLNGYRLYASWQEGIDDCYRLLHAYARKGAATVAMAIPVWAPPTDNNDDSAYIQSVQDTMAVLYSASAKR